MNILTLEGVSASYGHSEVLHDISFGIRPGGAAGLLGANGAGKTTTLRAVSGMVQSTGRIMFDDRNISGLRPDQIAALGIAHVPEGRGTLSRLTVRDNLLVGAYRRRDRSSVHSDLDYCFDLFPQLATRIKSVAAALSGGEQQMLAVGRAIMAKPRLLLLDEASLGLAPSTARVVYDAIARLRKESDLSMLIVEQNVALAFTLVDDASVLDTGHIVLRGTRDELMDMDSIRKAYLGG